MNDEQNNNQVENYIQDLELQLRQEKETSNSMQQGMASTVFNSEYNENLIKWQLDIDSDLERIEHLLRGDTPAIDENGNSTWEKPTNEDEQLFNDKGVREILKILKWYLNKNIILSNYSEDDIKMRVHQFSTVFGDFIFNNYQDLGLDSQEKRKHYPIVVMNVTNTVEAAYLRALHGGERRSLREARTVTQTEPLGMGRMMPQGNKKTFNPLKPSTWT